MVIARLTQKGSFEQAVGTVCAALQHGVTDVDSLLSLYRRLYENIPQIEPVRLPEHIPQLIRYEPDLTAYDKNLGGR